MAIFFADKFAIFTQKYSTLKFTDFNFQPSLQEGLDAMRFESPTPIQEMAIPLILQNKDLIACAQTGTGKTAAFVLPILNKIAIENTTTTNTLIVVPTRELAIQIDQAIQGFSYFTSASSIAIYGGGDGILFENEKRALTQGANIIIATPGRLMSHLNLGYVKLNNLKHFILDEADKMLDMPHAQSRARVAGDPLESGRSGHVRQPAACHPARCGVRADPAAGADDHASRGDSGHARGAGPCPERAQRRGCGARAGPAGGHDRGAGCCADAADAASASRLRLDRHERPDPVHAGDRPG